MKGYGERLEAFRGKSEGMQIDRAKGEGGCRKSQMKVKHQVWVYVY